MWRGTIPKRKGYRTLVFTETFIQTFAGKDFTFSDRKAFIKALRLLDEDEHHPSLRVHQLTGDRKGAWSVSASQSTRALRLLRYSGLEQEYAEAWEQWDGSSDQDDWEAVVGDGI